MATWIITRNKREYFNKILKHKKLWKVPIFIMATGCAVCSSYGNGHCPSYYVVSGFDVVFKVL